MFLCLFATFFEYHEHELLLIALSLLKNLTWTREFQKLCKAACQLKSELLAQDSKTQRTCNAVHLLASSWKVWEDVTLHWSESFLVSVFQFNHSRLVPAVNSRCNRVFFAKLLWRSWNLTVLHKRFVQQKVTRCMLEVKPGTRRSGSWQAALLRLPEAICKRTQETHRHKDKHICLQFVTRLIKFKLPQYQRYQLIHLNRIWTCFRTTFPNCTR